MKKAFSLLLVLSMLLMLMAGCASDTPQGSEPVSEPSESVSPEQSAEPEQPASNLTADDLTVVWGLTTLWTDLSPFSSSSYYDGIISSLLYDKLVYVDLSGNIVPRAAESWSMSDDGKTLTFNLRQDSKFHDGTPVTAHDWEWTFQMLSDPGSDFASKGLISIIEGTDETGTETSENSIKIKATGDYTLEMTFKNVTNVESFLLSEAYVFMVLPAHLLKDIPASELKTNEFWNAPVGSGPAVFENVVIGTELTLKRNTDYYMGDANWETMVFRQVDAASAATAMMTGEIDVAYSPISNDEALGMEGQSGISMVMKDTATQVYVICLNNQVMDDARVRQAINYGINKEAIGSSLLLGLAEPMELYIANDSKYYPDGIKYDYNPDKARELLEAAKADGFDGKFVLAAPAAGQRADVATLVQQNLQEVGFEVQIEVVDAATMFADLNLGAEGTYDGGIVIYGISPDPMSQNTLINANAVTYLSLSDMTYNEYQESISAEQDEAARTALVKEYMEYVHEETPAVWMVGKKQYYVYSEKLGDILDSLIGIACRNVSVWDWVISK